MVIVDTSVWIDFFRNLRNPHTLWLARELTGSRLAITDLIFCELLQGIKNDKEFHFAASELRQLHIFSPGSKDFALAVAGNFRSLRKKRPHDPRLRELLDGDLLYPPAAHASSSRPRFRGFLERTNHKVYIGGPKKSVWRGKWDTRIYASL